MRFVWGLVLGIVIGAAGMWIATRNYDVALGPLTHDQADPAQGRPQR